MRKLFIPLAVTLILTMPFQQAYGYAVQNAYTPVKTVDNSNDAMVYFQSGISKGKINDFTGANCGFFKSCFS